MPRAALGSDPWTTPTPQELAMTSEAEAPGAAAVYLDFEQINNEDQHQISYYVRIKILTEAGKSYGDVELPYDKGDRYSIKKIEGRTIHSDGTVIPFTGKPFDKEVVKSGSLRYNAKVFTMPDVNVGSILEYRFVMHYDGDIFIAPRWHLQRDLFTRRAHYSFVMTSQSYRLADRTATGAVEWSTSLPKGAQIVRNKGAFVLDLTDVPAVPDEDFMPPKVNLEYRVFFYYIDPSQKNTADDYWARQGVFWSAGTDLFINQDKLKGIAASLVAAGDSDQVKVGKLYDAMMQLENTEFTRAESEKEEKKTHTVVTTAADVWKAKRGTPNQITLLFIGLARAAGLKAYNMYVSDRDLEFFDKNYLDMDQLDDDIAIVVVDGKEQYFDPGERYCLPGQLHWRHTSTMGLRQGPNGASLAETPGAGLRDAQTMRGADLQLDASGRVSGTIRVAMTGSPALGWRQRMLETDAAAMEKEFEADLKSRLPSGVDVQLTSFEGLEDWKGPLIAHLTVTGSLGTVMGKRMLLPADLFEAGVKPRFLPEKREFPVYMDYVYADEDDVTLALPSTMGMEAMPKDTRIPLSNPQHPGGLLGIYRAAYEANGKTISLHRAFAIGSPIFPASAYPELRDFYGKVNAQDHEQVVLREAAAR
ncbi:MAG: DUF3857 domain-containing protein [Acidobacteriaceae bacterium]